MKTVCISRRISVDEDSGIESVGQITFFYEDVTFWHEGAPGVFKSTDITTLVNLKEYGTVYLKESYDVFTKKMTKFLHNQKKEIIFKNN